MKNEMRKGECRYCHAMRLIEQSEDLTQEELDRIASEECDCDGARLAQSKEESRRFAFEWAEGIFESKPEALTVIRAAILAVNEAVVSRVSMKIGKNTYTVTMNARGEIQIQNIYHDKDVNEF